MTKNIFSRLLLLSFIIFFLSLHSFAQKGGNQYAKMATEVLRLVNDHRKGMGLKPMTMNTNISQTAAIHSSNMAKGKVPFSHDGFDERVAYIRKMIPSATGWAENVAMGASTAQEAIDMWLHSAGHKENIEGDYNVTGIGIVKSKDGNLYFTEIFFKK